MGVSVGCGEGVTPGSSVAVSVGLAVSVIEGTVEAVDPAWHLVINIIVRENRMVFLMLDR